MATPFPSASTPPLSTRLTARRLHQHTSVSLPFLSGSTSSNPVASSRASLLSVPRREQSGTRPLRFGPAASAVPQSSGSVSTSVDLASELEGVVVYDLEGRAVPILSLWSDRKAVVGFARHFGCVLCRRRADLLASKKDVMDAAGVSLVLIGPGSVDQAKAFSAQTNFKGEVYADPGHSSFKALSFASGVLTTFTPAAGMKIVQSYMEGYRQDWALSSERDTVARGGWQQGGVLVAGPGENNIFYLHKDKEAGDDPDVEEVLSACCS